MPFINFSASYGGRRIAPPNLQTGMMQKAATTIPVHFGFQYSSLICAIHTAVKAAYRKTMSIVGFELACRWMSRKQKIGRGEDIVEAVPLQLGQEDVDVQRVAEIVQEAGDELEDANVQLKVPPVAVHNIKRRYERDVGEDLKAKGDGGF